MLEKEFKYFQDHRDEIVKRYPDKFVVIKDEAVIGAYDSEIQAYTETKRLHEVGTFLIQQCLPNDEAYVKVFHRVFLPIPTHV